MNRIKYKAQRTELMLLDDYVSRIEPNGQTIEALFAMSILNHIVPRLRNRADGWHRHDEKLHSITLLNHEARAIAYYITMLISSGWINNSHDRAWLDDMRNKLTQALQ